MVPADRELDGRAREPLDRHGNRAVFEGAVAELPFVVRAPAADRAVREQSARVRVLDADLENSGREPHHVYRLVAQGGEGTVAELSR